MAFNYTQDFEGLSNGDLDGQDSWSRLSGSANAQQVQTSVVYGGSKAVSSSGSPHTYARNITAHSSGIASVYCAMRCDTAPSSGDGLFFLMREISTSRYGAGVKFIGSSPTNIQYLKTGGWANLATSISLSTWYVINMEFDVGSSLVRYRWKVSGGSFSSFTSWETSFSTAPSQIDRIDFGLDSGLGYYDSISETDPVAGGGSTFKTKVIFF